MTYSHFVKFTALCAFLLLSCNNVVIDNQADFPVRVKIDDEVYKMLAETSTEISLSKGTHQLTVTDATGQILRDTTFELKEGALINAAEGEYVLWRTLYGLQTDRETLLNEEWVEMDSVRFFGDFQQFSVNTVVMDKNWDYALNEAFPETQNLLIFKDFIVKSKIFRRDEFKAEYRRMSSSN